MGVGKGVCGGGRVHASINLCHVQRYGWMPVDAVSWCDRRGDDE